MKKLIIVLYVLAALPAFAQNSDAQQLLERVKQKFSSIKDYRATIKVKVDVDFLKVPETEAQILFKQPDKIRIKSDGFAMLPKQGLDFSPLALLKGNYTSFYDKEETINGFACSAVKVVPLGDSKDIILSTLWIDKEHLAIRKVESTTKFNGTFTMELNYDHTLLDKYPLPASMVFTFDITKMNIPKTFSGDLNEETPKKKKNKLSKGSVYVTYLDYKVNTGLKDDDFKEKQK